MVTVHKAAVMTGEILLCLCSIFGKSVPVYVGCNIDAPITQIVFGLAMLFVSAIHLDQTTFEVHWLFCDLIRVVNGSVMLLVSSGQCLIAIAHTAPKLLAGEVIGLCASALFAYDAFLVCHIIRSKLPNH